MLGFEGALRVAFIRAIAQYDSKEEAIRCLKLSRSYLADARAFSFSSGLMERYLTLSSFYRILAHRIYLHISASGEEKIRQGFLRVIK
jgi:hypothetical protein